MRVGHHGGGVVTWALTDYDISLPSRIQTLANRPSDAHVTRRRIADPQQRSKKPKLFQLDVSVNKV